MELAGGGGGDEPHPAPQVSGVEGLVVWGHSEPFWLDGNLVVCSTCDPNARQKRTALLTA